MAKLFMNDGMLFGDIKTLEQLLKLLPALRPIYGWIGHPMRDVVDMRRHIKPFFQIFFGGFVQMPEETVGGCWLFCAHGLLLHGISPVISLDTFYPIPPKGSRGKGHARF